MQTSRRIMLTRAAGAGALIGAAGLAGLFGPSVPVMGEDRAERRAERQYPKIHNALDALRSAREELSVAGNDFHGHKDAAIRAVDAAIRQLEVLVEEHPH